MICLQHYQACHDRQTMEKRGALILVRPTVNQIYFS